MGDFCLYSFHFHWGKFNYKGSEHRINGRQYPLEAHFVHFNCNRSYEEIAALYSNESQVEAAEAAGIDYHELGVISIMYEVNDEDNFSNPAFDAIFTILDDAHVPTAEVENDTCVQQGFNLKADLDLKKLIPFDHGLMENGFFSYEGSLTTPPCTTDARWYLFKTTGCISTPQLMKFRDLLGAYENGTTYPMYDVFREIQEHNYTKRPVYECGEMRQDPMVNGCSEKDGDRKDDELMWFIIGIVFIVLFGVSMVIILFLLWNADCCTVRGKPSRSGGYHSANEHDHEHDETELVDR